MSDLITTAQDTYRNACIDAVLRRQARLVERSREERGQTAAEYMGVHPARLGDHRRRRHTSDDRRHDELEDQRLERRSIAEDRHRATTGCDPAPASRSTRVQDPPVARRVLRVSGTFGPRQVGSSRPWSRAPAARRVACGAIAPRRSQARRQTLTAEYVGVLLVLAAVILTAILTYRPRPRPSATGCPRSCGTSWAGASLVVERSSLRAVVGRLILGVAAACALALPAAASAAAAAGQPRADRPRRVEVDERRRRHRRPKLEAAKAAMKDAGRRAARRRARSGCASTARR